jgi:hypothetical protein
MSRTWKDIAPELRKRRETVYRQRKARLAW